MYFLANPKYDLLHYKTHIAPVHNNLNRIFKINLGSVASYYANANTWLSNIDIFYRLIKLIDIYIADDIIDDTLCTTLSMDLKIDSKYRSVATVDVDKPYIVLDELAKNVIKVVSVDRDNYNDHLSLTHPTKLNLINTKIVINPLLLNEHRMSLGKDYLDYLYSELFIEFMRQSFLVSLVMVSLKGLEYKPVRQVNSPYVLLSIKKYVNLYANYVYLDLDYSVTYVEALKTYVVGGDTFLDILCSNTELFTHNQYTSFVYMHRDIMMFLLWQYTTSNNQMYISELRNILKQVTSTLLYAQAIKDLKGATSVNLSL